MTGGRRSGKGSSGSGAPPRAATSAFFDAWESTARTEPEATRDVTSAATLRKEKDEAPQAGQQASAREGDARPPSLLHGIPSLIPPAHLRARAARHPYLRLWAEGRGLGKVRLDSLEGPQLEGPGDGAPRVPLLAHHVPRQHQGVPAHQRRGNLRHDQGNGDGGRNTSFFNIYFSCCRGIGSGCGGF